MTAKKTKEPEENIEDFVLKNEERILEILKEKESKAKDLISEEKEKGKAFVKGMVEAVTNKEVTEHFMSMGLEFALGIGALIKAMPWPEEMKPFVDMVSEQKDAISTVMCRKNPNCNAKTPSMLPSGGLEKIELD